MKIDIYTKSTLTIIAISLTVIAARGSFSVSSARAFGEACGQFSPCHVEIINTPDVNITNVDLPVAVMNGEVPVLVTNWP